MASSVALNRKPMPLRPVRPVDERQRVKTLAGLKRAIIDEIVQHQAQIEEIERREAIVELKLQAAWDDFERLLEDRDDHLRALQAKLLGVLEELAKLRGRKGRATIVFRQNLQRARGAYRGLMAQHEQRQESMELLRGEINAWADMRLDALHEQRAKRRMRNAELFAMLEKVEAGIATYGARCPAKARGATVLMAPL